MKIAVISPTVPKSIRSLIQPEDYFIIAVDAAVEAIVEQGMDYQMAVGDFDSLNEPSLLHGEVIRLNPIKDDSDTAKALEIAFGMSNDVILIGGTSGARKDHFVANLMLLTQYPDLVMMDEYNQITIKSNGTHNIEKKGYDYLSVFPIENSLITLTNVKYPLYQHQLNRLNPLGLSNEIDGVATLIVHEGKLLVFQSKEK
jgi:thiamine pyrophosphokinase